MVTRRIKLLKMSFTLAVDNGRSVWFCRVSVQNKVIIKSVKKTPLFAAMKFTSEQQQYTGPLLKCSATVSAGQKHFKTRLAYVQKQFRSILYLVNLQVVDGNGNVLFNVLDSENSAEIFAAFLSGIPA